MTTKNDDVLIKVEGLHKIYGDFHALNGINEEIHKGEVVVVVGPSGSGKSTFLRSLNLLEVPDQGHIYFEGVDITVSMWYQQAPSEDGNGVPAF